MASIQKNALIVAFGQVSAQTSSFVRNIILARLISPSEFGIASLFAMTLQVVEILTNVAAETFLVQSKDGDEPELQGTLQLFRVLRGLCNGLVILLLGGAVAKLFGVPQAGWAFRSVGLLPIMRGLSHLDITRLQRHMRFAPSVATEAGASWLATLGVVPLAFWLRDYRAMLAILLGQGLFSMVLSHLFAERRYAMAWRRDYWRKLISFGWPLTVNGFLMFGIFEGDRIAVGSAQQLFPRSIFTLTDLGMYSVAFSLAQAPTMVLANASSSLFLPMLSRLQALPDQFRRQYVVCFQAVCAAAGVTAVFLLTGGKAAVSLLFGQRYATEGVVIGLIGAMWAVRIVRVAPTIAALAVGDTKNTMWANAVRSLALVGMFGAASLGGALFWIPLMGLAGELLALGANTVRLRGRTPIEIGVHIKPTVLTFSVMAAAMYAGTVLERESTSVMIAASVGSVALAGAIMLFSFGELRNRIGAVLRHRVGTATGEEPQAEVGSKCG